MFDLYYFLNFKTILFKKNRNRNARIHGLTQNAGHTGQSDFFVRIASPFILSKNLFNKFRRQLNSASENFFIFYFRRFSICKN